jgi:hypothetical protein
MQYTSLMSKKWTILSSEQKAQILICFVERYGRPPRYLEEVNGKLIGQFWKQVKYSYNPYYDEIYKSILSKNSILRKDYENI